MAPEQEMRVAHNLMELTDALLWEDSEVVVLDAQTPNVDMLDAVRLIKGTRWDVTLQVIGDGDGAARAERAGATVAPPTAWDTFALPA